MSSWWIRLHPDGVVEVCGELRLRTGQAELAGTGNGLPGSTEPASQGGYPALAQPALSSVERPASVALRRPKGAYPWSTAWRPR